MATSQFQNIRAALNTLITARFTTDAVTGVTITNYPPTGDVTRGDRLWLERIRVDQGPLTAGGTSRGVAEEFEVDVQIWVPNATGADETTQGEAEARAETILASVENALRADSTVGGTVMYAELDRFESIPTDDSGGPVASIEAVITCQANL